MKEFTGRTLPHSIEAEEQLLSCCMLDSTDMIPRCQAAGINEDSFYDSNHGIIFGVMAGAQMRGVKDITMAVVAEELKASNQLEKVGGYAYLAQVTGRVPTSAQSGYFIDKVRAAALQRLRIKHAAGYVESIYAGDTESVQREAAQLRELDSAESGLLPAVESWDALEAAAVPTPDELVKGVLHKGGRMILAASSKSHKSWCLIDLGLSVASGLPWWGMATTRGRVLFVNFEIPRWSMKKRIQSIAAAKGIKPSKDFEVWNLVGYAADIDQLLPYFEARGVRGQYSLIILAPIYVCLGERDENSNSDVTELMNRLAKLARITGAAVAFEHHFSKGNQSEKDMRDRSSGAGAWVRAPDTVLTMTPHKEEGAFCLNYVLRNLSPKDPVVVRWKHPCMEVAPGLSPSDLKEAGRPKESTAADVVELLSSEGMTSGEWEGAAKRKGISESTWKRRREEAVSAGLVEKTGPIFRRVRRAEA